MSEDLIISGVLLGERKALKLFLDLYLSYISRVVSFVLVDRMDVEEASQDAIYKIINALASYNPSTSIKAWMYTIAHRTAIDHYRKIKKNDSLEQLQLTSPVTADNSVNQNEQKEMIRRLLDILDSDSKQLVIQYYLEEKKIKELEKITGLTESNIKIKLFRARKEMALMASKMDYFHTNL